MKLTVTFRHLQATEAMKNHIESKLEKLKKYLIRPIDVHVIVSVEKFRQQCEITVKARDFHAHALETNHDLYVSIDKTVNKIDRQIKRHKEIVKDHKHQLPTHTTAAAAEDHYTKVIEEKQ